MQRNWNRKNVGNVDKIGEKLVEKCGFLVYNWFNEKINFSGSIISLLFSKCLKLNW